MSTAPNLPISHSEFQARQFYERWIGRSGILSILGRLIFKLSGRTYSQTFIQQGRLEASDRVLELGCGFGAILAASQLRIQSRETYVGLDLCYEMVSRARNKRHRTRLPGQIVFLQGSALTLPLCDQYFDVVLLSHMIKYLTDNQLDLVLNEVKRVLKDGGRIVIWEFGPFISPWVSQLIATKVGGQKLRSANEIARSLEGAGFLELNQFRIVTPWVPWENVAFCARL